MAKQTVNIGSAANDGSGDSFRTGFDKINDNFTELYTADSALDTRVDALEASGSLLRDITEFGCVYTAWTTRPRTPPMTSPPAWNSANAAVNSAVHPLSGTGESRFEFACNQSYLAGFELRCNGILDLQGRQDTLPPAISGVSPLISRLRWKTGCGRQAGKGSSETTDLPLVETADGLGTGWYVGANLISYGAPTLRIENLSIDAAPQGGRFTGDGGSAPTYLPSGTTQAQWDTAGIPRPPSTAIGLCVNGSTGGLLSNLSFTGWGIGLDTYNNTGGLRVENCWWPGPYCNVGWRLGNQSGSDYAATNLWIHGAYSAVSICGDTNFRFFGGQISANNVDVLGVLRGLSQVEATVGTVDYVAAVMCMRDPADGYLDLDGAPGLMPRITANKEGALAALNGIPGQSGIVANDIPTKGGAAFGDVTFLGVNFEGTRRGWALMRNFGTARVVVKDCEVLPYQIKSTIPPGLVENPYGGSTPGEFHWGAAGGVKWEGFGSSYLIIEGGQWKGAFDKVGDLVDIVGATAAGLFIERGVNGYSNTAFGDFFGSAYVGASWLQLYPGSTVLPSSLATLSGIGAAGVAASVTSISEVAGGTRRTRVGVNGHTWTRHKAGGGLEFSTNEGSTWA